MPKRCIGVTAVLLLLLLSAACGGSDAPKAGAAKAAAEAKPSPDTTIPPEQGGPGFEQIAEQEGWQTFPIDQIFRLKSADVQKGGRFNFALPSFPTTLRPVGKDSNSTVNSLINGMMYERMLSLNSYLEVRPNLATHWKISEDQLTFSFRLNPYAYWADGKPVTTEDVYCTWKLMVDKGILSPYENMLYEQYEEPVVVSKYIITVKAKELNWRLFLYFGAFMDIFPAHYIKDLAGGDFIKKFHFDFMPGTGPYYVKPKDIKKGSSITLTRRTDYWDKDNAQYSSNFDKIKIKIIRDERLTLEKFKKGEIDYYHVNRAQWWAEEFGFDEVKRGIVQRRKVYTRIPQGFAGFAMNMLKPPFNDKRVRLAICHLFNRKKLIEKLFYNQYTHLDSYFPNTMYANSKNPVYRYDPNKALGLLEEAGYNKKDNQGILLDANGNRLEFDLTIDKSSNRIMTVVQEDFKQAGVKMNIKFATPSTIWQLVMDKKFRIHFQSWAAAAFPNPEAGWSSELADKKNNNNVCGVKNARIDELAKEYNVCFDQKRRVELIQELDYILTSQEVPYALGWYAPFDRVAFWNKFGMPKSYFGRRGDWRSALSLWWYDPKKDQAMEAAVKNSDITLPIGETDVKFWHEFDRLRAEDPDKTAQEIWDSM